MSPLEESVVLFQLGSSQAVSSTFFDGFIQLFLSNSNCISVRLIAVRPYNEKLGAYNID